MSDSSDWEAEDAIFTCFADAELRSQTRHRRKASGKAHALLGIENTSPTKRQSERSSALLSQASPRKVQAGKAHALLGIGQVSPVKERFPTLPLRKYGALGEVRRWIDKPLPPSPSSSMMMDTPAEMYARHVVHDTSRRGSRIRWSKSHDSETRDFDDRSDEVQEVITPDDWTAEQADHTGSSAAGDALQSWVDWVSSTAAGIAREAKTSGEDIEVMKESWRDDDVDADDVFLWYGGFGFEDAVCIFDSEVLAEDDGDSIIIAFP